MCFCSVRTLSAAEIAGPATATSHPLRGCARRASLRRPVPDYAERRRPHRHAATGGRDEAVRLQGRLHPGAAAGLRPDPLPRLRRHGQRLPRPDTPRNVTSPSSSSTRRPAARPSTDSSSKCGCSRNFATRTSSTC